VSQYRVIVVGGGHAGVEAAWAAANMLGGVGSVALVTLDPTKVGEMSCNPAIGGLAKGQLVREVDAMGGVMGLATDATGINFKVLNQTKGPASQGPRAQCDKHAYARAVRALVASRPEIVTIAGSVERLVVRDGACVGCDVATVGGGTRELRAPALVLTTGTFMRGLMHTGENKKEGGRFGEGAAVGISHALRELGFELGRLKTGTPPRLKRQSIAWESLSPQWGDEAPQAFSDLSACAAWAAKQHGALFDDASKAAQSLKMFPVLSQVDCRLTSTSQASHEIIRSNLHRAPMFSGQIEGAGPRYCPSIEDKVVRFADRETHGVFLEPESLESDWVYCNGVSTSLPSDVQDAIVRGMPGCEHAEILRYGYAVEYDMVRPHQILATGQTRSVRGLYLAGQINGTSGYEEAAAQGLLAGVNAALAVLGQGEFILSRSEAYLGVLMDDLVTKTPVEPYRMFTSRAEHRLLLRSDNAAERLTPRAIELGILQNSPLGKLRLLAWERRSEQRARLSQRIDTTIVPPHRESPAGTPAQPLEKLLRGQAFEVRELQEALHAVHPDEHYDDAVLRLLHAERRYVAYIVRQQAEVKRQASQEQRMLPSDADYLAMPHLRTEAKQALHRFRPRTFGQAARLEGVTPADITLLSVLVGGRK
jgi:tRNA uridine 5-carboxymethylaminomethyl modification enzyme